MNRYSTPLRYPGGKQRLAPFIAEVLNENGLDGGDYVEPFAGGAGVAIDLLLTGKVSRIHLNDLSRPVYAFWRAILTKTDEFCRLIASASLTVAEWRRQKNLLARPNDCDQLTLAFSFFYLNRCNRSGIPSGGVIGGLKQTGTWKIGARFPRNELIRRIELIAAKRSSITVKNWDAEVFLTTYVSKLPKKTLVYCDPPYFQKSDRLYLNHYEPADHAHLAKTIQQRIKASWLVSYDAVPAVVEHYSKRRSFKYDLQYNAATAYKGTEVFIISDNAQLPRKSAVKCIDAGLQLVSQKTCRKRPNRPHKFKSRRVR
jgi:DNA adenine methylase